MRIRYMRISVKLMTEWMCVDGFSYMILMCFLQGLLLLGHSAARQLRLRHVLSSPKSSQAETATHDEYMHVHECSDIYVCMHGWPYTCEDPFCYMHHIEINASVYILYSIHV